MGESSWWTTASGILWRSTSILLPRHSQLMPPPLNVPCAVPDSFKSPVHDALKDPLAVVAVCSVTFHLKSVHAFGDGMRFEDDQLPSSALIPVADGPVTLLLRSKPMQPAAAAATDKMSRKGTFFISHLTIYG